MTKIQNTTTDQLLESLDNGTTLQAPIVYLFRQSEQKQAENFKTNYGIQSDVILLPLELTDQSGKALATVLKEHKDSNLILMDDYGDLRKSEIGEIALNTVFGTQYA